MRLLQFVEMVTLLLFGPGQQYGIFPAFSAGWNIDQEHFFKKLRHTINQLKLRGSYGELGNSNIGRYNYITTYGQGANHNPNSSQSFTVNGAPEAGYTQQSFPNVDIQMGKHTRNKYWSRRTVTKWEKSILL